MDPKLPRRFDRGVLSREERLQCGQQFSSLLAVVRSDGLEETGKRTARSDSTVEDVSEQGIGSVGAALARRL